MATFETGFPAIRACIFDLDGLLINSEDIITLSTNKLLKNYGRPAFTPSIRAQLMGVPDSTNGDVFHNWAKLPISHRQVLGDDPRLGSSRKPILPNECLVFEDSVARVEAGRRAGMRVIWVPHPDMAVEYAARQKDVLAGRTGIIEIGDDWQLGEIDNGWAKSISSLEHFDYEKYSIDVRS
ncbi:hypothetical protein PDE_01120 [Penicillium oxalicum 114-2]|uniref:Uncharacterized protein n=1 Tax=Penicillium oxalicum (strain 114-2 / CGMCC 5302) TaxID=933388 RepID=S7Z7N2_PENO1|nr:hypothetical protein PDE_01120 [Penicillium oxalicum 114-2]